ncbi:MAG TPA: M64 family metallopeptidase [Flavipsychrobacter sp.]|nr:M64 family metallopeptidase [Flavipsychrobacter sp.]
MKNILLVISLLRLGVHAQAQTPVLAHKVVHGPDSTRYNFLVTGEGFTAAQLSRLEAGVDTLSVRMFRTTPFKEYKNFFNFHLIKLASPDSGLVHPATAPNDVMPPYFPTNCFDTRLDYAGVHNMSFMYNAVAWNAMIATYYPGWDNYIHFLNTPGAQAHGGFGTGLVMALPNLIQAFHTTTLHELGHAMGGLADEYWINTFPVGRPNRDTTKNPGLVKWKNWIGSNGVGIDSFGTVGNTVHYRPTPTCRMRSVASPFCAVCIEG